MRIFRIFIKIMIFIPFHILYPVKVIGRGNIPCGTYLAMSNHLKWFDILLLWFYLPGFKYFLAKKELKKRRFNWFVLWLFGAIFIDREKPDLKGLRAAVNALKDAPLAVFPEGTRNREDTSLQTIKGGAAMIAIKADAPLVPIIINKRSKILRKNHIFISAPVYLPYNSTDRLDSEVLKECTRIISEEMSFARDIMDQAAQKNKREAKALKREHKHAHRESKRRLPRALRGQKFIDEN